MDTDASHEHDWDSEHRSEGLLRQSLTQWPQFKEDQSPEQSTEPNTAPLEKLPAHAEVAEAKVVRPGKVFPKFQLVDKEHIVKAVPGFTKQMYAMAAFCNFEDKKEFHRLQFSPPFLSAYGIWLEYSKGQKEYLRIIADEDMDLLKTEKLSADKYPKTFHKIRVKYRLDQSVEECDRRMNERFGLASLLFIVSRNLREYPSRADAKKLELDEEAREEFGRVINKHVPLHFNPTKVTNFDLGPFPNETSLDRIQRINYVFHSIRLMATPSKWEDYHLSDREKCKLFTKSVVIHSDWSPDWLRPEKESKGPSPTPTVMSKQALGPHSEISPCTNPNRFITTEKPIYFDNHLKGDWACFSNFFAVKGSIIIDGLSLPTAEHHIQHAKARLFNDQQAAESIELASTPKEAQEIGGRVKNFDQERWDKEKELISAVIVYYKFQNVPDLRAILLGTGDVPIAEASLDRVWGIGFDEKDAGENRMLWGENLQGHSLMATRAVIRKGAATAEDGQNGLKMDLK